MKLVLPTDRGSSNSCFYNSRSSVYSLKEVIALVIVIAMGVLAAGGSLHGYFINSNLLVGAYALTGIAILSFSAAVLLSVLKSIQTISSQKHQNMQPAQSAPASDNNSQVANQEPKGVPENLKLHHDYSFAKGRVLQLILAFMKNKISVIVEEEKLNCLQSKLKEFEDGENFLNDLLKAKRNDLKEMKEKAKKLEDEIKSIRKKTRDGDLKNYIQLEQRLEGKLPDETIIQLNSKIKEMENDAEGYLSTYIDLKRNLIKCYDDLDNRSKELSVILMTVEKGYSLVIRFQYMNNDKLIKGRFFLYQDSDCDWCLDFVSNQGSNFNSPISLDLSNVSTVETLAYLCSKGESGNFRLINDG